MFLLCPLAQPHCPFLHIFGLTHFHWLFVCFGNLFFRWICALPCSKKTRFPCIVRFDNSRIRRRKLAVSDGRPTMALAWFFVYIVATTIRTSRCAHFRTLTALCGLALNHKLPSAVNCYYTSRSPVAYEFKSTGGRK